MMTVLSLVVKVMVPPHQPLQPQGQTLQPLKIMALLRQPVQKVQSSKTSKQKTIYVLSKHFFVHTDLLSQLLSLQINAKFPILKRQIVDKWAQMNSNAWLVGVVGNLLNLTREMYPGAIMAMIMQTLARAFLGKLLMDLDLMTPFTMSCTKSKSVIQAVVDHFKKPNTFQL